MRGRCSAIDAIGLVNNVIYVIFLSAADDLLRHEPDVGKSSVLLADIIPCIFVKLIAPYFIRVVPYWCLITTCLLCALLSLSMVALFDVLWLRMVGIILASAGSGLGETSFLALTTYYHPQVVIAWSSGTGTAGIVGAFYYLAMRTWFGLSLRATLLLACVLPFMMALAYFVLLRPEHQAVVEKEETPGGHADSEDSLATTDPAPGARTGLRSFGAYASLQSHLHMIRPLIFRFILPLFLVYYAEYVINNSVFFSLLYPLTAGPFDEFRQYYPTYQALYQTGVFLSRTFGRALPVTNGWMLAGLQAAMLVLLSLETAYGFIGNVWVVFALILFEGLLGGAAYVNTFCNITHQVPRSQVEFSMAFTGIADSTGIGLAGLTCLLYEPFLCQRNPICRNNRGL